jgi:undecaprenyl-diphosphatase
MNLFEAFFLGFLQGLTEFLPVSSSGHLVIFEHFFELQASQLLSFDILLHIATLLAVCIFFRERLWKITKSIGGWFTPSEDTPETYFDRMLVPAILLTTLVTGVIGIVIKDPVEGMRDQTLLVGVCFLVTATLLLLTHFRHATPQEGAELMLPMNLWLFAFVMGLAQGIAILPGVSRSGTTICVALLLGATKQLAVEYSFLIAIPAILGAMLLEMGDAEWHVSFEAATLGFLSSLISGVIFLWFLVWIVQKGKLHQFAYYLIPLGILVIWLS